MKTYLSKAIFTCYFFLISLTLLKAQETSFSYGSGIAYFGSKYSASFGYCFTPRFNFYQFKNIASLSIGTHAAIGKTFSYNDKEVWYAPILIDIPVLLEFNLGNSATNYAKSIFGAFVGIGFGYNNTSYNSDASKLLNGASLEASNSNIGMVFNLGLRVFMRNSPITFRYSYMKNNAIPGCDISGYMFTYNNTLKW